MSRFKLVNIFDTIFVVFTLFLIIFSIIQFFVGNFWLSLLLSCITTFAFLFIYHTIKSHNRVKKEVAKITSEDIENCYSNFAMLTKCQQLNLIKKFIPVDKTPCIKSNKIITSNQIIEVSNNIKEVDKSSLIEIIKGDLSNKKEIVIVAYDYSQDAREFVKTLNTKMTLLDKNNFYLMCKQYKIMFKNTFKKAEKIKFKNIIKNFFHKKHAKGFFFSGFVLIFTGFIVPFKNYYLFFGVILLIFSLICKIKKQATIEEFKF